MTESDPLRVHCDGPPSDRPLAGLKEAVKVYSPKLIIIDPIMFLLRVRDLNDYANVQHALQPWHELARQSGSSVLALHHNNKKPGDGQALEILGSTSILGLVDTAMVLSQDKRGRAMYTRQRYGTELEPLELRLEGGWVLAGRPVAELKAHGPRG